MNPAALCAMGGAAALSIGVLIGWSGVPAPDGLNPPPGPVTDTQPSLNTISEQLADLQSGAGQFPPDLQYFQDNIGGNQTTETVEFVSASEADYVRIYSVFVDASTTNMLVGQNEDRVAIFSGSSVSSSGQILGGSQYNFGGLRVPTPVKFQTGGQNTASRITLLYWVAE